MAPIPKKTYSRKNNELSISSEKENVDPFDDLFSSPLKQDVTFKPLSFWTKKHKSFESRNKFGQGKNESFDLGDSDSDSSPYKKKKKTKYKSSQRRGKLQSRPNYQSLPVISTHSFTLNKIKSKDHSLGFQKRDHDEFQFVTLRRKFHKGNLSEFNSTEDDNFNDTKSSCFNLKIDGNLNKIQTKKETQSVSSEKLNSVDDNKTLVDLNSNYLNLSTLESDEIIESKNQSNLKNFKFEESNFLNTEDYTVVENDTGYFGDSEVDNTNFHSFLSRLQETEESILVEEDTGVVESDSVYFGDSEVEKSNFLNFQSRFQDSQLLIDTEDSVFESSQNNTVKCVGFKSSDDESTICQSPLLFKKDEELFQGLLTDDSSPTVTFTNDVCNLASKMSDMTILSTTANDSDLEETVINKSNTSFDEFSSIKDNKEESNKKMSIDYQYVTVRRQNNSSTKPNISTNLKNNMKPVVEQDVTKFEKTLNFNKDEEPLRSSAFLDEKNHSRLRLTSDRFSCFGVPIFESTRVEYDNDEKSCGEPVRRQSDVFEEYNDFFESTINLKSGKKWFRSKSVLKNIQNGNISDKSNSRIKGRNFESFVQEMVQMQNVISAFSSTKPDMTISNKTIANIQKNTTTEESSSSTLSLPSETEKENFDITAKSVTKDLHSSSVLLEKTFMNHTVKVLSDLSINDTSAFRTALGLDLNESLNKRSTTSINLTKDESSSISARDFILNLCGQQDVLSFEKLYNEKTLKNCKKIGEGVYGEVFMCDPDTVLKIIPIEGPDEVNGEPQKKFEEILSEVVIASKLSNLRNEKRNRTSCFSELKGCRCVFGKYPRFLLKLWNEYDQKGNGSENDSPAMFKPDQLYIVLELANGGKDLESYVFNSAEQCFSAFIQAAFSLAAAEKAFEFEHRDLHWGNVLLSPTTDKFTSVILNDVEYKIPTKGVKICIIDFTLSRVLHEGCCIFNDLSIDPGLFVSQGDYQFDIYRIMRKAVNDDWSAFKPKTNLFWLHYILDKMLKMVRYRNTKTAVHKKFLKKIQTLETVILKYDESTAFVLEQKLIEA